MNKRKSQEEIFEEEFINGVNGFTEDFFENGRECTIEKIEEEYDIEVANQAYNEYVQNGKKSRPINQLWKELGL